MVRLQQDIAEYHAELNISRTHTPAVSARDWDSVQTTVEAPAPMPEVHAVEKLVQRLVTDTRSPTELEQPMRPSLAEQRRRLRRRPATSDGDGDSHAVDRWLQRLGTMTQSCPPLAPTEQLKHLMCSFIVGQRRRRRPPRRDWSYVLCFSCGKSGHAAT